MAPQLAEARSTRTPRVMSAFLSTMDRFLAVEQTMMGSVLAFERDPETRHAPAARPLPLLSSISTSEAGTLVACCTLDIDRHPFLRDHTLGRNVSAADPLLTGFPIVPFTGLMEVMAETALALAPGKTVIGMREVRVHRWLAVDRGPIELEVRAEWTTPDSVSVRIEDLAAREAGAVAEGVMLIGDAYPEAPAAAAFALERDRSYKWAPGLLYEEAMFHGPMFRGVRSIDRVGDNGAEATLVTLDADGLTAEKTDGLATDFVLLDQPGQVVGFWTSQYLERGFVVLPFRMGSLDLYGPPPPAGEVFSCRARIELIGDNQVRSDLDVIDRTGRLWARFEGWEDRRFDLPATAFRALLRPVSARLSSEWTLVTETDGSSRLLAYRISPEAFPRGWLIAHGGMWSRVLGSLVLSRRERDLWHALKMPERRRLEWLLGRVAAKDAVREFLHRRFQLDLHPADVEILPDASGRPEVTGTWTASVPRVPLISISHVDGEAVALLSDADGISGVGIDLERFGRMKPEMEHVAFRPRELEMLQGLEADERQTWALRLWCAKEASAKAVGGGVGPVSDVLAIDGIDRGAGTVFVRYTPSSAAGTVLSASTVREGEWVVATCIR